MTSKNEFLYPLLYVHSFDLNILDMSPLVPLLEAIRIEKGLSRSRLARKLKMDIGNLSNIVYGRKSIPKGDFLQQLITVLNLNLEEQRLLIESAEESRRIYHLPDTASLEEYQVAHAFHAKVGQLPTWKLRVILDIVNN